METVYFLALVLVISVITSIQEVHEIMATCLFWPNIRALITGRNATKPARITYSLLELTGKDKQTVNLCG